jgi:hypothetical protein
MFCVLVGWLLHLLGACIGMRHATGEQCVQCCWLRVFVCMFSTSASVNRIARMFGHAPAAPKCCPVDATDFGLLFGVWELFTAASLMIIH